MGSWERLLDVHVAVGWWERLHLYYIDVAVGALSPDGLVGETPLINYEAVDALGLVGETPLIYL